MSENETLSVPLPLDIPLELRERLDALASRMNRPRGELVKEAIDRYLTYHAWKRDRIREGVEAADGGDLHDHDRLFSDLRDRYAAKPTANEPG